MHRDIKPGNIFLTAREQAKILDFGLAKVVRRSAAPAAATPIDDDLTSPGVAIGTLHYMSPEQARREVLDARTDLFSFGAVLYEMATGKQLSSAENAVPSTINPKIPGDLDRIVGKALDPNRDRRYQSASDLIADVKSLNSESPVR